MLLKNYKEKRKYQLKKNDELRLKILEIRRIYGSEFKFLSKVVELNYTTLIDFKNNTLVLSLETCEKVNDKLDERFKMTVK